MPVRTFNAMFDEPPNYSSGWEAVREAAHHRQSLGLPPVEAQYCNVDCAAFGCRPTDTLDRVRIAIASGVRIAAHPGVEWSVTQRREFSEKDIYALAVCQLGALNAVVLAEGGKLTAVKPHGLLYVLLRDRVDLMRAFVKAHVAVLGRDVPFVGMAHTTHESVCAEVGLPFVGEVTVDGQVKAKAPVARRMWWGPSSSASGSPSASRSAPMSVSNAVSVSTSPAPSYASSVVSSAPSSASASSSDTSTPEPVQVQRTSPPSPSTTERTPKPAKPATAAEKKPASPQSPPTSTVSTPAAATGVQRLCNAIQYYTLTPIPHIIAHRRTASVAS